MKEKDCVEKQRELSLGASKKKKQFGGQKWNSSMNLVCSPNLQGLLSNANLLIDTCTIIDASKCQAVNDFLFKIKRAGCNFISISAVRDEFTCSANNLKEYQKLSNFVKTLDIGFLSKPLIDMLKKDAITFKIALSRCRNINPSYVDRLLLSTIYFYRNSPSQIYLITSNHRDIPNEFFDRVGFITHDIGGFHNIGVYGFNQANFMQLSKDIIDGDWQFLNQD